MAGAACPRSDGSLQPCQAGSSKGVRLHATLLIGSIGLLIPARGAGWSLWALTLLQACPRPAGSSFWWPAPFPCPHTRPPRPRVLSAPSLCQAALSAAGPSACFHVCDVSDCVCRVLVYMGRRQRREGEGMTLREASEKKEKKNKVRRKNKTTLGEIPLFCDRKQKAFIFMAIRDG